MNWFSRYTTNVRFMRVDRLTGYETEQLYGITAEGSSCKRDYDSDTFESASLKATSFDIGTDLVRCYFDPVWADGSSDHIAIGTWLPSDPKRDVNGPASSYSVSLYGRLKELADDEFEYPFTVGAGDNVVQAAADICRQSGLEVVADASTYTLSSPWTFGLSRTEDESAKGSSKLEAVNNLLKIAGFDYATTDPMGRVVMREKTGFNPVWEFVEGPRARFLSEMQDSRNWFDVPNIVKVTYSNQDAEYVGIAVNDDPNSRFSTVSVGRRIVYSETFNDVPDEATDADIQALVDQKAQDKLEEKTVGVRTVVMSHVYAPVTARDIVSLQFPTGNVSGKFRISSMSFDLGSGGLLSKTTLTSEER